MTRDEMFELLCAWFPENLDTYSFGIQREILDDGEDEHGRQLKKLGRGRTITISWEEPEPPAK